MRTKRRSGFTLAEMLVVVAIIGILAAILVPAVYLGLLAAKNARIAIEVGNLAAAMEDYKRTTHGQEFPPNFGDDAKVRAHIQRKFGKYNPAAVAPAFVPTKPPTGLDAAEALVFWLNGYGPDVKDPLKAGTRQKIFAFDETRLKDKDNDTHMEYYPRDGQGVPYVYFHHDSDQDGILYEETFTGTGTGTCYAYKSDRAGNPFVNPQSYQIISAGQDGDWGANSASKLFPSGGAYAPTDRDNITNFSEGTLGSRQE